jgi:hypothetical protein
MVALTNTNKQPDGPSHKRGVNRSGKMQAMSRGMCACEETRESRHLLGTVPTLVRNKVLDAHDASEPQTRGSQGLAVEATFVG